MNPKALDYVLGQDWIAVVGKNGTREFATAFVAQPVLHASVLNAPCIGVEPIAAFFAVTSGMYDRLAFIHETKDSSKICLEWEGKYSGKISGCQPRIAIAARESLSPTCTSIPRGLSSSRLFLEG
jgi:hypothetical protein